MSVTRRLLCYFIISVALLTVSANAWSGDWITAITIPSADVTLSFIQPGRIDKVYVREGDLVKANQTLIKQDDAAEQAQLLLIRKQSEDTNQIEAQKASLAQKRVYLERLEWVAGRGSATVLEVEYAKLEVKKAELSLKEAEFGHDQNKRKYKEAKIRVNNMRLKSPIAGRVDKIEVEVGESINGLANVVRVVRTDPLWLEVHVPLEEGGTLGLDQTAEIIFPGNEEKASKGKIIFISTVADAASSTLRVRIEVPNTSNRPAGEHASVLFPTQAIGKVLDMRSVQSALPMITSRDKKKLTIAVDDTENNKPMPGESNKSWQVQEITEETDKLAEKEKAPEIKQLLAEEEKTESKEYYVQVGAWHNPEYARHYLFKVKKYYPEVYIEIQNDYHLVRIPGVMTKMQGAKISKDIEGRFKLKPLLSVLNKR